MPRVIKLKDDKVETLFGERDFEYLLEKYMGYEAVEYFRKLMSEKEEAHSDDLLELQEKYEETINRLESQIQSLEEKVKDYE